MAARDEFSAKKKRILANRVAYRCLIRIACARRSGPLRTKMNRSMSGWLRTSQQPRQVARVMTILDGGGAQECLEWHLALSGLRQVIDSDEPRFTTDVIRKWKKRCD